MILIGAIAASFKLHRRQIGQFIIGIFFISLFSLILAFCQQYNVRIVLAIANRLYPMPAQDMITYAASRVTGTFANPNAFGGSLTMLSALVLPFAVNIKGLTRYILVPIFIGLGAAILITTASRTSLLGYLAISGLSLVLSLRKGSRFPAFLVMIVIMGTIMFVRGHVYELSLQQRIQDLVTGEKASTLEGYRNRLAIWVDNIKMAKDSLLWGVGPTKAVATTADNGYLFTLVRLGIFGLLIYLLMLFRLLIRGIRTFFCELSPYKKALMLSLTMVLANHIVFEITGEFFWNVKYGAVFSVFLGVLGGLIAQIEDERKYADYIEDDLYNESMELSGQEGQEPL
jgi:O-antigen ligase